MSLLPLHFSSQNKALSCFQRYMLCALCIIFFDQMSKWLITQYLYFGEQINISAFFNLVLTYNKGAAFNFLSNASGWQHYFLSSLAILVSFGVIHHLYKSRETTLFNTGLSLILGGALGNLIDRLIHGHVIDFLDFHVNNWHWPAFNIADSTITLGVLIILFVEFNPNHKK